MSRILAAAETERVREFGSWLLREAPGVLDVLQHPSVLTRDALGEGWHIFDWDPTVLLQFPTMLSCSPSRCNREGLMDADPVG